MKIPVYVIMEEDRGCGPSAVAVFFSKEKAEAYLVEEQIQYTCWVAESYLHDAKEDA